MHVRKQLRQWWNQNRIICHEKAIQSDRSTSQLEVERWTSRSCGRRAALVRRSDLRQGSEMTSRLLSPTVN